MFLEGFIGDELNRIRSEEFRRINPPIASYLGDHQGRRPEPMRARIGTGLIRAGAWLSGARVDECLDDVAPASPVQV